jgi:hypothetical protein
MEPPMNTVQPSRNQKSHRRDAEAAEKKLPNRLLCELRVSAVKKMLRKLLGEGFSVSSSTDPC